MKKVTIIICLILCTLQFGFSQDITEFSSGEIITADAMNGNFLNLKSYLFWQPLADPTQDPYIGNLYFTGGNVGIGTDSPDTLLQIEGGANSGLIAGTGFVQIGTYTSQNIVLDSNEIQARNNGAVSPLFLQALGGGLIVNFDQAGNEFVITEDGNVGIGYSTPAAPLVIMNDAIDEAIITSFYTSDSRYLKLLQPEPGNGSDPFTWLTPNAFAWRIDTVDRMILGAGGYLGIGEVTPEAPLHVSKYAGNLTLSGGGNIQTGLLSGQNMGIDTNEIQSRNNGAASSLYFQAAGGAVFIHIDDVGQQFVFTDDGELGIGMTDPSYPLDINGGAHCTGSVWADSDRRYKEHIKPIESTLERLEDINGVSYSWRNDERTIGKNFPEGPQIGLIAQEVEEEFPELVNTGADGYKAVAYDKFTAVLLQAIKEQQTQIESQQDQIDELRETLSTLSD